MEEREIQAQAKTHFEVKRGPQRTGSAVGGDWAPEDGVRLAQKKVRDQPAMTRRTWIGAHAEVTQKRQCVLTGVAHATFYARASPRYWT
jgi:hypothetical protein